MRLITAPLQHSVRATRRGETSPLTYHIVQFQASPLRAHHTGCAYPPGRQSFAVVLWKGLDGPKQLSAARRSSGYKHVMRMETIAGNWSLMNCSNSCRWRCVHVPLRLGGGRWWTTRELDHLGTMTMHAD